MDAAQKLICKEIGTDESPKSVLNSGNKTIDPFHPVSQEDVQLLHDEANHWFLSFCSNGRVQVCDSLRSNLICQHLTTCLEMQRLTLFPDVSNQ